MDMPHYLRKRYALTHPYKHPAGVCIEEYVHNTNVDEINTWDQFLPVGVEVSASLHVAMSNAMLMFRECNDLLEQKRLVDAAFELQRLILGARRLRSVCYNVNTDLHVSRLSQYSDLTFDRSINSELIHTWYEWSDAMRCVLLDPVYDAVTTDSRRVCDDEFACIFVARYFLHTLVCLTNLRLYTEFSDVFTLKSRKTHYCWFQTDILTYLDIDEYTTKVKSLHGKYIASQETLDIKYNSVTEETVQADLHWNLFVPVGLKVKHSRTLDASFVQRMDEFQHCLYDITIRRNIEFAMHTLLRLYFCRREELKWYEHEKFKKRVRDLADRFNGPLGQEENDNEFLDWCILFRQALALPIYDCSTYFQVCDNELACVLVMRFLFHVFVRKFAPSMLPEVARRIPRTDAASYLA